MLWQGANFQYLSAITAPDGRILHSTNMASRTKGYLLILTLCLCHLFSSGQQRKIDSLLTLLKTDKEDTTKVKHLNTLCNRLGNIGEYDKGLLYGKEALKLARSIPFENGRGWSKGIANSYNRLGLIYWKQGNFSNALENYFASLKIWEKLENKEGINTCYNNIGLIYSNQGNYDKALENYFASIRIAEEIGDKRGMATAYANIGIVYYNQGNFDKALENYFSSIKNASEIGFKQAIASSYSNIGLIYWKQARYDKALEMQFTSLKINKEMGDKRGIAISYNNIGDVYAQQGQFEKALETFSSALKIHQEIGNQEGIAGSHINIGNSYLDQKKITEAKTQTLIGLSIAKKIGSKEWISNAYKTLSQCDSASGDWKSAYQNQKLFKQVNDSVFNAESAKKTAEMSALYESEKKESQIKLLEKDKEKQSAVSIAENKRHRTVLISVVSGLSLMILFSIFMVNRFRITQKQKKVIELQKAEVDKQRELADSRRIIAEEQRHVIEIQKSEVEHQKHLVEEHQKDIIDSITYAKRLQEAILPPNEYVKKHLPESFILYKPKDIVAGDFYWMEVKDDIIFIAAADCTGHGVPGAMVSIVCSNALNRTIKEFGLRNTGAILDKVTELVIETFEKSDKDVKDGMDISLLAINKSTNQIHWSGANNPLWYIYDNELIDITANKQPIGKHDNRKPFVSQSIPFQPNTTFYLFTDGYADQFGGLKGKKFKYKQLEEKLLAGCQNSMSEQKELLDKTFDEWRGNLEQVDDVCIIGIRM